MVRARALGRELRRSIGKTMGRYLAIVGIVALGTGFLAGLRTAKPAMMATAQKFVEEQAMFDLRVMNTYGYTQDHVDALARVPGVGAAEGAVSLDVVVRVPGQQEDVALRLHSLPEQISLPNLTEGRMPVRAGECLADGSAFSSKDIGTTITVSAANEADTLDSLGTRQLTIVGLCASPLYLNFERGTTTVGSGSLSAYLYVPMETFQTDGVFTEICLRLPEDYPMYDEDYHRAVDALTDAVEPEAGDLARSRYETVLAQARQKLEEGWAEYNHGLEELTTRELDGKKGLGRARSELNAGRRELEENEAQLTAGEDAFRSGRQALEAGQSQLTQSRIQLQQSKAQTYTQLAQTEAELLKQKTQATSGLAQIEGGLAQIEGGLTQIQAGLDQIQSGRQQLELVLGLTETGLSSLELLLKSVEDSLESDPANETLLQTKAELEARLQELEARLQELEAQQGELDATQAELEAQRTELETTRAGLEAQRLQAQEGLALIEEGYAKLESGRTQAADQFAAAEAQLEAAALELEAGLEELEQQEDALLEARQQLEAGRAELEARQAEFDQAVLEFQTEIADGKGQLRAAKGELEQAERELSELSAPDTYLLDRMTNAAYACFDSDTSIVNGISQVFPLFFFSVAALVCMTTMSKMVDEERTQIGVLKALGYGSFAINRKYLIYAGSATLIGSVTGVIGGSLVFPSVIWMGYRILYSFTPFAQLAVDGPLCVVIVLGFTAGMLLVTWLCCRRSLTGVPADLIRPRAPKAGKRILLERLSLWHRMDFLHKVAVRNVLRYRKRLIMMLLGVGGCAALVVAGFGLRDTIRGFASYQFENISVYDMSVTFGQDQSLDAQEAFRSEVPAQSVAFLHQSAVDLNRGQDSKSVQLLLTPEPLEEFWNFRAGDRTLPFPEPGQALLSNGVAHKLGIRAGDTVSIRTSDMKTLRLTVSGIFDNSVYNYILVHAQTAQDQWGHVPQTNTAYVNVYEGQDIHETAALASRQADVVNVSAAQDLNELVSGMLSSLDYIVGLVVLCAAALAFIVIYNLTNINITERIREIATIKVLGFYPMESALYVFREGLILTGMGCVIGLVAGYFLNDFIVSRLVLDMVYFVPKVAWTTYAIAAGLTFLFAILVDVFLYFKLEHINMAEALKSVE